MKKLLFTSIFLLAVFVAFTQTKPKQTSTEKQPKQAEMDKMMEDAMKGMSDEEKVEMKEMMKGVMPALTESNANTASYPQFTKNKELVPKKDAVRINAVSKKKLTQADMPAYASGLYTKIMTKGEGDEIKLVKSIIATTTKASDLEGAAILCMLQGHPQAAMALSMKAVQADPSNTTLQNNMASLLTQYGYPEQAIPVLRKLKNEYPANSTVLNNLAIAWLDLGQVDSTKIYSNMAIRANPYHPEAKLCGGLVEELTGDPIKATDEYVESMENCPNPFTEDIIKKNNGQAKLGKLDFDKIKRSITIYEYFPKDWIKIPKLSDRVSGYENDMRIKNGYQKMFDKLNDDIEAMKDASEAEMNALFNKGETAFASEMGNEAIKGLNMMSMTAVTVQMILQTYLQQNQLDNSKEYMALNKKIDAARVSMTKISNNDKCPDFDRKNDEFLAYANPLIREFHAKRIDDFRNWLNAFCTWVWYIAGNPKNTVMSQCIGWTAALSGMYSDAIHDQEAIAKSCVSNKSDGVDFVQAPDIPNFTCPTLVSFPTGSDWQQLGAAAKDFNKNNLNIKKAPKPIPNASIGYGIGSGIAQPGKDPFIKTANGNLTAGMINDDDLTPLSKIPLDDLNPLPDLQKSKIAKALLKKMMTTDCNEKSIAAKTKKFTVGVGTFSFVPAKSSVAGKAAEEAAGGKTNTSNPGNPAHYILGECTFEFVPAKSSEAGKTAEDAARRSTNQSNPGNPAHFVLGELEFTMDLPTSVETGKMGEATAGGKTNVQNQGPPSNYVLGEFEFTMDPVKSGETGKMGESAVSEIKSIIKDFNTNGLQPSISSGVQVPGTFETVNGLFQ